MPHLLEKIRRTTTFHYFRYRNEWEFPDNMSHMAGSQMATATYEPDVLSVLRSTLSEGHVFIDVGANIGYFSRKAAELVGESGRVYAFEPGFDNYYALNRNLRSHSNVHTLRAAISDRNGCVSMNASTHAACHSLVQTSNRLDGTVFNVMSVTLDHFWETYAREDDIQLLKIDVEGAEMLVLSGMTRLLGSGRIRNIIIEFCPSVLQNAGFNVDEYYRVLSEHFTLEIVETDYRGICGNGSVESLDDFLHLTRCLTNELGNVNLNLFCRRK